MFRPNNWSNLAKSFKTILSKNGAAIEKNYPAVTSVKGGFGKVLNFTEKAVDMAEDFGKSNHYTKLGEREMALLQSSKVGQLSKRSNDATKYIYPLGMAGAGKFILSSGLVSYIVAFKAGLVGYGLSYKFDFNRSLYKKLGQRLEPFDGSKYDELKNGEYYRLRTVMPTLEFTNDSVEIEEFNDKGFIHIRHNDKYGNVSKKNNFILNSNLNIFTDPNLCHQSNGRISIASNSNNQTNIVGSYLSGNQFNVHHIFNNVDPTRLFEDDIIIDIDDNNDQSDHHGNNNHDDHRHT